MEEENGMQGTLTVKLYDEDGNVTFEEELKNLITDAGDLYQATRVVSGVNSNGVSQPTLVTGMKLGTGTTAAAKSGAGGALVTYLTASNKLFDSTYPQVSNLGAGLGVNAVYRCTWAAGTATSTSINEIVIVNDAGTNATSTAANTIARAVFGSAINKGASEALEITWNHKCLGA
jgi:hypothetical protein